jgi:hypothetical protein
MNADKTNKGVGLSPFVGGSIALLEIVAPAQPPRE